MVVVQKDELAQDNAGVSLERDNKTAVDKKAASTSANKNAGKPKKPTSIRTAAHQGSLKELEQMLKDGVGGCLFVCLPSLSPSFPLKGCMYLFTALILTLALVPKPQPEPQPELQPHTYPNPYPKPGPEP